MKHFLLSAAIIAVFTPWAAAEIEWDEIPGAQTDAYAIGKAQRKDVLSQREILFCKAHWEGYSEAVSEQEMYRLFPPLTADLVYGAVDYWAAKLEISDYDAELEIADAAYYALIHIGPSAERKIEAARKLGACAPGD